MPNDSRKQRSRHNNGNVSIGRKSERKARNAIGGLILLGILVVGTITITAIANWRSLVISQSASVLMPSPTPPSMPASAPAKEYVYAGSSLISTVEPFRQAPSDLAVFRPSTGDWWITTSQSWTAISWGFGTDVVAPADFDGDGKTDLCVYRPSDGVWYIIKSTDGSADFKFWGLPDDVPVPGDFTGDGSADAAVWRPSDGVWYVLSSSGGWYGVQLGTSTDIHVPADYDGDGKFDFAVWRGSTATFWVHQSTDGNTVTYSIGQTGDQPVPEDYS